MCNNFQFKALLKITAIRRGEESRGEGMQARALQPDHRLRSLLLRLCQKLCLNVNVMLSVLASPVRPTQALFVCHGHVHVTHKYISTWTDHRQIEKDEMLIINGP